MTFYFHPRDHDLLLALAWTAPLTTPQMQRLVAPATSLRTVQRRLLALRRRGLLDSQLHSHIQPHGRPRRSGRVWSLTTQGVGCLDEERSCPASAAHVRFALLE